MTTTMNVTGDLSIAFYISLTSTDQSRKMYWIII